MRTRPTLAALLLPPLLAVIKSSRCECSSPSGAIESKIAVESSDDGTLRNFTTIQWQIGLGETACYKFEETSVRVTYSALKSVYPIINSYAFFLADEPEVRCTCDCPGGRSRCRPEINSCHLGNGRPGGSRSCFSFYSSSSPSLGCFLGFLRLSGAVCCSVDVKTVGTRPENRAVQLSVPNVIAVFKVVREGDEEKVVNIDLNSGAIVSDFDLRLQVSSSGPSSSIPAGWYSSSSSSSSTEDNNKNGEELLGNVPVNELNEWNVNKLGWIKSYDAAAGKLLPDENVLKNAFSLKVLNCQRNEYSAELNSAFIGPDQLNRARRLKEIFPFIRQVQLFSRHVEISHSESPFLIVTAQHSRALEVILRSSEQFSRGFIGSFDGKLAVDQNSNKFLYLKLKNVAGSLSGFVSGLNGTRHLRISTGGELRRELVRKIRVSGIYCDRRNSVTVFLRAQNSTDGIAKKVSCVERRLAKIDSNLMTQRNAHFISTSSSSSESTSSTTSWFHWTNPLNWIGDTGWTVSGSLIVILILTGFVAALVILICVKLWKCCCCC